ncbi:sensor domain-containing diguanylate cyclase [Shewanella fidelis]|uniref:diguanylate cyclase n=1 Tax=Shewanella fidelis TaxID=173509 RepID=A0AAW8NMF9_9GAMM|nr:diguanylate cyclase [Shewanella fidelis]MDR8523044.1 diguanylate cyclase [Shewanella fidelis]MDW4811630.1 diguanylate cyclase [Shewanella fidelis]MDW4815751.1 diguanylate cyclase [Shewanella fidelis]MDW4819841.1 diguanylate cyclase [Shewanella fidelis]MDW4824185.1 diguanylate cyclase [Shewanella fidelis]
MFASAVFAFRIWVQLPIIEKSLVKVSAQELTALNFAFKQMSKPLHTINYDYAVWDRTYSYMKSSNMSAKRFYEQHEYPDDTFKSLKVDGVFVFNNENELVFSKGFNHDNDQPLVFTFTDFKQYPQNKALSPQRKVALPPIEPQIESPSDVPSKTGVIATQYGPALFSSTTILQSNRTGPIMGYLVFIRLIDKNFIDELSQYTVAGVTMSSLTQDEQNGSGINLDSNVAPTKLTASSTRIVHNIDGKPLFKLVLNHTNTSLPPLIDSSVIILLAELSTLLLLGYLLYSYFLVNPVRKLAVDIEEMDKSREIKKLQYSYRISELVKVATHFNALMGTIQEQTKQLNEQAYIDKLTNIPNRRSFEQRLETYCQLLARQQIGFTLIIADVDHFKEYNDNLGHLAGDEALMKVAQVLTQQFYRAEDICARFGGEEFIMLFRDIPEQPLCHKLEAMINGFKELNLPHPTSKTAKYVTVSFGVCTITANDYAFKSESSVIARQVILAADKALYHAKASGRNQFSKTVMTLEQIEQNNSDPIT